ncbi:NAD(P)H-dependent oxidoreductase [Myroides pelagicus]|uniref:Flavodoxin family protein n=1 Tax=Myroides pelagicus TaxID=270914 RepID=A0A7K1GMV4_9FLAO|nr:NAD(P)H-dependent oxidoreductase [Myroides pelagicus]MEC4114414.1 NAD(P)H-dependent oxidoreductase [Myroides pelagicus]MTH30138.1 flavodoxin family protein [Myroides pelagicus]
MKKITVINGHPNTLAFNHGLVEAYVNGAKSSGAEVRVLTLAMMQFDVNLRYGYQKRMDLEPDLIKALEDIRWADHLVWVHPVWWGGLPALMKGFIDRLFLPGITFKYRPNSIFWDKLLKGKTARIITTLDQPGWYYWLKFGRPSVNQLKKSTLEFCGVSPVKVTYIGIIRSSKEEQRARWLEKVKNIGRALN